MSERPSRRKTVPFPPVGIRVARVGRQGNAGFASLFAVLILKQTRLNSSFPGPGPKSPDVHLPLPPNFKPRIQFSSPLRLRGGPGMLSKTSLASRDFLTMTSFSRTAVCMRRTLDRFLREGRREARKAGRGESWIQSPFQHTPPTPALGCWDLVLASQGPPTLDFSKLGYSETPEVRGTN